MKNMSARLVQFYARIKFLFVTPLSYFAIVTPPPITIPTPLPSLCPVDKTMTDLGCLPKDPIQFIGSFYLIGLGLIGGVSLLFIIIGGYTIMTSRGNATQVNTGKSYIFYAIAGLLLAIFGYLFIEVLLIDILHIPGFGR